MFGTKIEIEAEVAAVERAPLILPQIDILESETVRWRVVTEDNMMAVIKQLETDGFDPVLIGVTDEDYESLAINQAKQLKLILQQRAVIKAYKDYYILYLEETKDGDDGTDE